MAAAYKKEHTALEKELSSMDSEINLNFGIPIKIIHVLSGGRSYNHSHQLQQILANTDISPTYIVPEKKQQLGKMIIKFLNNFEREL